MKKFSRSLILSWWRSYHIGTSPLIWRANQWTVFYMIGTSIMKELILSLILKQDAYWELSQTSKMELCASILDLWQGSDYAFGSNSSEVPPLIGKATKNKPNTTSWQGRALFCETVPNTMTFTLSPQVWMISN